LFTVRSELVEHHKGQISFPGGAADASDPDLAYTAQRETFEEIGVAIDHVEIIGQLDEMITVSNFLVRPFVGRITEPGPYPFAHSEIEVAEILEVPLSHLREEANVVADLREYQGREVMMYSYVFGKHIIWGATARILKQFLDLLA
jgi:8-oxo-dGTP pyrophosphatase MutT (NUDIX family)